ncbi:MAG: nitrous oxide reductase family maturation protein NosD, partial [Candidatus Odinarchaeota archaeon]
TIFEFDNHGIFFGASYNIDLLYNTIYWNEGSIVGPACGIYLVEGAFANIEGNNITQNSDNGITLDSFHNVTIVGNYIYENWIHGISIEWSDFCVIEDNYIGYNGEGTGSGPMCGVSIYYSDYIEIVDNEFWWNALNSITVGLSNFAYISHNYINHSYDQGIWIYLSHNATIEENEIYNCDGLGTIPDCGILVEYSNDTSLINNILGSNTDHGIAIESSHNGEISGNMIFDSYYVGLYLTMSSGWEITHNVIFDNGAPGIVLDVGATGNYIYYNDIGWSGEYLVTDIWGGNYWNTSGVGNWYSDYNGTGTYSIFGIAEAVDYYPSSSLYLGTTTPYEYEVGTTGNTMTWAASALNPGTYELLIDGVSQGHVTWDGSPVAADVDGLPVGVYNVTLIVYHVSGHWLANQSTLTVVDTVAPTWIQTPQDQVLEYNEALSYQLQASDPSGIDSWSVNDTVNFAISSSGLLTNATFLEPGIYYVEITVTDLYSHSVTVTIMITVNEPIGPPIDPTMLMLAVGGAGAVMVIILVIYMFKKKSG